MYFGRVYKKSKSESSRHNAEIAIRNFELFCSHVYHRDMDDVIDDLIEQNNQKKTFAFFQKFVDFMQEDHLDIMFNPPNKNAVGKPYEAKMPSSIKSYIHKCRKYAKMRGLSMDLEDFTDNVSMPTIEEELDPEPFTHDEIRLVCNYASHERKLLYMSMKDSGARDGELCQVRRRDIDFEKDPVEIYLPAKITKGKKARIVYISMETAPDLQRHCRTLDELDLVYGTNENVKKSVENEIAYFGNLRKKLSSINPVFAERYEHNNRFKKNIHSLRSFTSTQAEEVHGVEYAHGLIGHKKYLAQYIRNKKKLPSMYKKLEPQLLIYEKVEILESDKDEKVESMQKQLNLQGVMIREMQKNLQSTNIPDIEN